MEHDPFAKLNAMISRIEGATNTRDVEWLRSEVALLATTIPSGLRQSSSPLTEVVNALPNLLSAVNYFNTQGNANDRVFVTLFAALALLPSDPEHKLPFSIFHNVSRKAQGTSKYYVQLIRLHASGKVVYWL
ncbi:hypothetical protein EYR40_006060 [Pleurotus pulmonarius]|nr:hypothetical protein EYR40_006060 [Pleurotus pulmonarius]